MTAREGTYKGKTYILEHYESIAEFIETLEARPVSDQYSRDFTAQDVRSEHISNPRWTGAASYSEAKDQFMTGTKATKAMQRAYIATQTSRKRETVNAPCGGAPIVAHALLGLPNSMIDIRRKREPRTVRIIINMSLPAGRTAADITEAGKKIIAAVGRLDGEGLSTEIICSSDKLICGMLSSCGVVIKTAGQAFNAARVSFSMSSPAFLRVFQFMQTSSQPSMPYSSGYGAAVSQSYSGEDLKAYYEAMYGEGLYISLADVVKYGAYEIDRSIDSWKTSRR